MDIEVAVKELPLVAILRGLEGDQIKDVGRILIDAGFTLIEVTMNSMRPLQSLEILANMAGSDAVIGAGTVTSVPAVKAVKNAGGRFVISPNMDQEVIRATKNCGLVSWPGVFTPSEAFDALKYGADGLKLFPGEALSPQIVKAYRAVLPLGTRIFVVGGVKSSNMAQYLAAGADGFGIGSSLAHAGKSLTDIAKDAAEIVTSYDAVRKSISHD